MNPDWEDIRDRWKRHQHPGWKAGGRRKRGHRGLRRRLTRAFTLVAIFAVFLTSFGTLRAVGEMQRCFALEQSVLEQNVGEQNVGEQNVGEQSVRPAYCDLNWFGNSSPNLQDERSSKGLWGVWGGNVGRSSLFAALISAVLASGVAALMTRRITAPLSRLADAAQRLSEGERGIQLALPRANDEIWDLTQSFNGLVSGLERQEAWRRTLVADVAHDLRTPLAVMRAELEAMQDGVTMPDAAGLGRLHGEVLHLARLVSDLNTLSQAEGRALSLNLQPLELKDFLNRLHTSFLPRVESAGMNLEVNSSSEIWVKADPDRLNQVLYNLLENAVQYAGEGQIELGSKLEGNQARLWVRDFGPGLKPELLEQIFERFYRVDVSRVRSELEGDMPVPQKEKANSGLGLAIARALIRAQGGELWAENHPQGGAVFWIRLARAEG